MLSECELRINPLSSIQAGEHHPKEEVFAKIADYLDRLSSRTQKHSRKRQAVRRYIY